MSGILGRFELDHQSTDEPMFQAALRKHPQSNIGSRHHRIATSAIVGYQSSGFEKHASIRTISALDNDQVVVADAILDNRDALADGLNLPTEFRGSVTNAELIRLSFKKWGQGCLERLEGDFAFAVVDVRARKIFLARDHIGTRPLYWAHRDHSFIFGSSIESIVRFDDFRWTIDEAIVAEFLACRSIPLSKPFFSEIHAVPPGGFLEFYDGAANADRWWNPSAVPDKIVLGRADVISKCLALLDHAINVRGRSEKSVGSHFSGGVDSTIVTAIAARNLKIRGARLTRAYSWSPPISDTHPIVKTYDEREFAQSVADSEGFSVFFGAGKTDGFLDLINRPMEFEGPSGLIDEFPILEAARKDQLHTMLSGWGADEVFSAHGMGYIPHLLFTGKLGAAKRWAQQRYGSLKKISNVSTLIWQEVIYPFLPTAIYYWLHPIRRTGRENNFPSKPLRTRYKKRNRRRHPIIKFGVNPNENLKRHLLFGHTTARMESWAAWSAPFGFQYRYPMTDKAILEFLLTLQPDHIFMGNQPRGLAKTLLSELQLEGASKQDPVNEQHRADSRFAAWTAIAKSVENGDYSDDCPWIDKDAFLVEASTPRDQTELENINLFIGVCTAARTWALYRRAKASGWV